MSGIAHTPDTTVQPVRVTRRAWRRLISELERRGQHRRESGCFLLAGSDDPPRRIRSIAYFDDLDADCLTGGISLSSAGLGRLFERCAHEGLTVLADVHTHPATWVDQSCIDSSHPMIPVPGHLALIVPNYAMGAVRALDVGIYLYLGGHRWQTIPTNERARIMRITWPTWRTR